MLLSQDKLFQQHQNLYLKHDHVSGGKELVEIGEELGKYWGRRKE